MSNRAGANLPAPIELAYLALLNRNLYRQRLRGAWVAHHGLCRTGSRRPRCR